MSDVLAEILAHKRTEVETRRHARDIAALQSDPLYALPRRNFYGTVSAPRRGGPNCIAELKRASPSAGVIRADFDPVAIARQYEAAGAHALSVLTDEKYFGGRLEFLAQIKAAVGLPLLRKDFLIDPWQVYESRAAGADAVLIIAEALKPPEAVALVQLARKLELAVLLEVHSPESLFGVLTHLPGDDRANVLLGINNRDLKRQVVDLGITEQVAPLVPPGLPIVAESGVKTRRDMERLHTAGARALLVGETLLRAPDPGAALRTLFG